MLLQKILSDGRKSGKTNSSDNIFTELLQLPGAKVITDEKEIEHIREMENALKQAKNSAIAISLENNVGIVKFPKGERLSVHDLTEDILKPLIEITGIEIIDEGNYTTLRIPQMTTGPKATIKNHTENFLRNDDLISELLELPGAKVITDEKGIEHIREMGNALDQAKDSAVDISFEKNVAIIKFPKRVRFSVHDLLNDWLKPFIEITGIEIINEGNYTVIKIPQVR